MKKYLLVALVALVALAFAVPGTVDASVVNVEQQIESAEMDPALVEAILRPAAQASSYPYSELNTRYLQGEVVIEKLPRGFRVTVSGGSAIVLIEDSL